MGDHFSVIAKVHILQ